MYITTLSNARSLGNGTMAAYRGTPPDRRHVRGHGIPSQHALGKQRTPGVAKFYVHIINDGGVLLLITVLQYHAKAP